MDAELRALLRVPREAGTPEAAATRAALRARLEALGYAVTEHRFAFAPAALNAFPLFGAGLGWLAILLLPLLLLPPLAPWAALAVWLPGLLALGAFAWGLGLGHTPLWGRVREDATLVVRRPEATVRRWLVAHVDTKAQVQSTAGRMVAIWVVVAACVALTALAAWRLAGPVPLAAAAAGAALAIVAGALAGRGIRRGLSPGARDNATGLVAALAAAAATREPGVGLLLTGAEEFGLVGARALATALPELVRGTEVVNLDTLDDVGPLFLVHHDAPGAALAAALAPVLGGLGYELRRRRLPVGILVDSLPLARAGARAVTVGRLTWATLRRIHTPRDTDDGLAFETARRVGAALAALPAPAQAPAAAAAGGPD
ncbi:MAG TPA: M28 family peptidase [Gemmatimonadales bacterium]|nr:M28 family peptidase [Gemmatimonadales bacterium]